MKKLIIILVILIVPLTAVAQTKLAVTEIKVRRGVDPVIARVVEEFLTNEAARVGIYQVIGRDDIQRMFDHEQAKQMVGCDEDSCLAEIGGALGVDLLLAGSMDKVGETYLISLKLINIRTAEVTRRESGRLRGVTEEDAIDAVAVLFERMFKVDLVEKPKRIWTWVMTGTAVALAVTGAVLIGVGYADDAEAQSLADRSTTNNTFYSQVQEIEERSRSEKVAGGVVLGVGGAVAVTAILLYFFEVDEGPSIAVAPTTNRDFSFAGISIGGTF